MSRTKLYVNRANGFLVPVHTHNLELAEALSFLNITDFFYEFLNMPQCGYRGEDGNARNQYNVIKQSIECAFEQAVDILSAEQGCPYVVIDIGLEVRIFIMKMSCLHVQRQDTHVYFVKFIDHKEEVHNKATKLYQSVNQEMLLHLSSPEWMVDRQRIPLSISLHHELVCVDNTVFGKFGPNAEESVVTVDLMGVIKMLNSAFSFISRAKYDEGCKQVAKWFVDAWTRFDRNNPFCERNLVLPNGVRVRFCFSPHHLGVPPTPTAMEKSFKGYDDGTRVTFLVGTDMDGWHAQRPSLTLELTPVIKGDPEAECNSLYDWGSNGLEEAANMFRSYLACHPAI